MEDKNNIEKVIKPQESLKNSEVELGCVCGKNYDLFEKYIGVCMECKKMIKNKTN